MRYIGVSGGSVGENSKAAICGTEENQASKGYDAPSCILYVCPSCHASSFEIIGNMTVLDVLEIESAEDDSIKVGRPNKERRGRERKNWVYTVGIS